MTAYLGTNDALQRIQGLQNTNWYKVQLIGGMLGSIRGINFSVQSERSSALNQIQSLQSDTPYAVGLDNEQISTANIRFPAGTLYICEGVQPWNNYFQSIISSLTFKERANEKTMLGNQQAAQTTQNSATPSSMVMISTLADASQQFANTITNMLDSIATNVGVFGQASFEQSFNVEWGTPTFSNNTGRYGRRINTVVWYITPPDEVNVPRVINYRGPAYGDCEFVDVPKLAYDKRTCESFKPDPHQT
jgi:uncharacterized protein YaiE (UPF0345 family)